MFDRLAELRAKRENGEDGFTLIELLVVVVIIGILIAIAVPLYLNYRKGANDKGAQSDLRGAVSQFEQCNSDNSTYPSAVTSAGAITGCGTTASLKLSDGTTMKYTPVTSGTTTTSYTMTATNTNGGGKVYCYNSANGGSVKALTASGATTDSTC